MIFHLLGGRGGGGSSNIWKFPYVWLFLFLKASPNLLTDIGIGSSQRSDTSADASQTPAFQSISSVRDASQCQVRSQNLLDLNYSQSQKQISTQVQNLTENQFQQRFSQPSSFTDVNGKGFNVHNRIPASRINPAPDRVNVKIANSLKQVQSRLEDFPVIVSRMLEEGIDFVEKDLVAEADTNETEVLQLKSEVNILTNMYQDHVLKVQTFIEKIVEDLRSMSLTIDKLKKDKSQYLELIENLQSIVDKQRKFIVQLKSENSSLTTHSIKVESMDKFIDSSDCLQSSFVSPRLIIRDLEVVHMCTKNHPEHC